jgi:hypothetical protein
LDGYSKRFGSDLAIEAVSTTTRYALSEAFREDALYYRCDCKGVLPRLSHAVISTLTARRGEDGRRVFSFPALIAPYAGSMTAVYAWYPSRSLPEKPGRLWSAFNDQNFHDWYQNSNRNANCISRGVPDPTGVTGETVFTVLTMLPNPVVFEGLKVDWG